jgi:hypothetical protein
LEEEGMIKGEDGHKADISHTDKASTALPPAS